MNIEHLPHEFDRSKSECKVIIETPKGRRNKFKFDPDSGLFTLSRVLPEGFTFPFDFGFIPSTTAEDGDPLDVVVLMDEPAHVGCVLRVRIVGVIQTEQTENAETVRNDRLVAVAIQSFGFQDVKHVSELRGTFVDQVTDFIALYNKDSDKQDKVKGVEGPECAMDLLEEADRKFRTQESKK